MMQKFQANTESTSFNIMDEEAVIINTVTSAYFSMNPTGTYLWTLLIDQYCSRDDLAQAMSLACQKEINEVQDAVNNFLNMLAEADLVLILENSDSLNDKLISRSSITLPEKYEAPDLVKFGDLETLILSGE